MIEIIVQLFLLVIAVYLVCGIVFTFFFLRKGLEVIDAEGAHGAPVSFKIIIVPGIIVFWVLLLKKWWSASKTKKGILL